MSLTDDMPGSAPTSTTRVDHLHAGHRGLLRAVRVGQHPTFDRVVFDFDAGTPGQRVEYVQRLVRDGSGEPVPVRGRAVLRVIMAPADAHTDDGRPSLTGPVPTTRGFAALRQIVDAGDFEGVLTWGVGVAARTGFRVSGLVGPARVAVDVAHAPPGTGDQLLRRGDRSAAVATWQWRLRLALVRDVDVDEIFGPATEAATRDFQRHHQLSADGIVGARSRAAMVRALGI